MQGVEARIVQLAEEIINTASIARCENSLVDGREEDDDSCIATVDVLLGKIMYRANTIKTLCERTRAERTCSQ